VKIDCIGKVTGFLMVGLLLVSCGKTELSDTEYLQRAKTHLQQGDSRAAVIELKNALQQNPGNAEARLLLGREHLESGNYPAAEKELQRAVKLGLATHEVVSLLARSLLYQQKFDEVLEVLAGNQASMVDSNADLLALKAEAQLGLGAQDKAEQLLHQATQLQPDSYIVLLGYAKLASSRGKLTEAVDYLNRALAANPAGLEALNMRGTAALEQQQFETALESFGKVLDSSERNGLVPLVMTARLGRIRALLALGKKDEAGRDIEFLLKKAPGHPAPKYFRALLAYQGQDLTVAEDYLTQVVKQVPDHLPSLLLLGAINYSRGNYEQAEMYLGRYVSKGGNHPEAVMLLAATRLKRGQADLAMEVLRPAVEGTGDAQLLRMIGKAAVMSGDVAQGAAYLKKALLASNDARGVRVELANLYLNSGSYDEAIEALEPLATGEHDKGAQAMLVFAHLKKKEFKEALGIAKKLIAENPKDAGMMALLGWVQLAKGDHGVARDSFQKALKIDETFIPARRNLARLDLLEQDYKAADQEFQRILDLDAKNLPALVGKAQVAERRGDLESALRWWEKARKTHPNAVLPALILANYHLKKGDAQQALSIVEEALPQNKNSIPLLFLLARAQMAADMPSKALQTYQHLADKAPEDPVILFALSGIQIKLKQYDEARETVRRVLKLNADHIQAKVRLIELEMHDGRQDVAMRLAREIQKDQPDSALGYVIIGDIAFTQKQFTKARKFYQQAFDKQPSEGLLIKLAEATRLSGKEKAASSILEGWLSDHPDDALAVKTMLAMSYHDGEKKDRAIALYKEILEKDPQNLVALNNLSFLFLDQDPTMAREYAERAYQRAKDNPAVQDTLGWALVMEGKDLEQGVRLLREATRQAPHIVEIRYHLAVGLAKQGKHDEARKMLSQLLANDAEFSERQSAKKLLESLP